MSLTYLGFSAYRLLVIQADRITLDELGWHLEFGEKPESQETPLPERRKY